jgi:hypothetical protein
LLKKWIRPPLGIVTDALLNPDAVRLIGASVVELLEPPQATNASEPSKMANRMTSPLAVETSTPLKLPRP